MLWQIRLVVLISRTTIKWSNWPGKADWERQIRPTRLTHFWSFPLQRPCMFWYWQVGINPRQVSPFKTAFSHYKAPWNHGAGFITCLTQGTQTHWRVSKVKQKMCILRKQKGCSPECSYLSWRSWMSPQDNSLWWTMSDSWSPKKI